MSEAWRLFIALELPRNVLTTLAHIQSDLKRTTPPGAVRWVQPKGIHLTLKFLGDVPVSQLTDLKAALEQATSSHEPFELAIEGLGCFPNTQRPRVLWAGVTGELSRLNALQSAIERFIAPLGYPTERDTFSPHLTLGRTARQAGRDETAALGRLVEQTDIGQVARWRVEAVSLMRSQLKPDGAVYTELHQAKL
jgi:2'-5' RNA ligase